MKLAILAAAAVVFTACGAYAATMLIAMLARSVTQQGQRPAHAEGDATRRLLGVAQWLVGRRTGGSP